MPQYRAVIQEDDLVVYESLSDAAAAYGKTPAMILRAAECGTRCGGKRWRFKVDDDPDFGGLVVCEETGERFSTPARAARTFNIDTASVLASVLGAGPVDERYTFHVEDHRGKDGPVEAKMSVSVFQGPVFQAHISVREAGKGKEGAGGGKGRGPEGEEGKGL